MTNGNDCAYPADSNTQTDGGLTKREYFAAMAMQGILASATYEPDGRFTVNGSNLDIHLISRDSADCADALISALNQHKPSHT